jgi:hypothetical protein
LQPHAFSGCNRGHRDGRWRHGLLEMIQLLCQCCQLIGQALYLRLLDSQASLSRLSGIRDLLSLEPQYPLVLPTWGQV